MKELFGRNPSDSEVIFNSNLHDPSNHAAWDTPLREPPWHFLVFIFLPVKSTPFSPLSS